MWGSVPREGRVRRIELGIVLFSETASNYALEWFSEAGSAPIRSAVKFYFDIDVRIFFQLLQKKDFSIDPKKNRKSENFRFFRFFPEIFKKVEIFQRKSLLFFFENFRFF